MAAGLALAGCGMPGAPLPPSLNLPQPVKDLSAVRAGDQVTLHWTVSKRNTDKLLQKGNVQARVCSRQSAGGVCATVATLQLAPGAKGAFSETLPAALAAGAPRVLTYFVELENRKGRSAGLSNGAVVLAGKAPPPVTGLTAEMSKRGVVLHWNPVAGAGKLSTTAVRLRRILLTPPAAKPQTGMLAPAPEPVQQNLLVPAGVTPGRALDPNIQFGATYEYRAQRVVRVTVAGKTLELAGASSSAVRIHAINSFPPEVPTGLAAVATPALNGAPPSIDLSWRPDAETDVAGYVVYRRQEGGPWQRISPAQPVVGPAFDDVRVQLGRTYVYAVSAVGRNGLESARSSTARETVPKP